MSGHHRPRASEAPRRSNAQKEDGRRRRAQGIVRGKFEGVRALAQTIERDRRLLGEAHDEDTEAREEFVEVLLDAILPAFPTLADTVDSNGDPTLTFGDRLTLTLAPMAAGPAYLWRLDGDILVGAPTRRAISLVQLVDRIADRAIGQSAGGMAASRVRVRERAERLRAVTTLLRAIKA